METDLEKLIYLIGKLPGLGKRSARRVVLHLLQSKESLMLPLADAMVRSAETIITCAECGNLDTISPCSICTSVKRDNALICIVEEVADLWAFERCNVFNGKYHVLGGTLSALDGRGPSDLNIEKLIDRATLSDTEEIIIATNATVEGQTTAHYISERLNGVDVKISRLAHGIPMGGELDYMDEATLSTSLRYRSKF